MDIIILGLIAVILLVNIALFLSSKANPTMRIVKIKKSLKLRMTLIILKIH